MLSVNEFHSTPASHRPDTRAKIVYDDAGIYVIFRCEDRFVRCTRTEHQSITSRDSCVEAYLQPKRDYGYLNFEINCCGAMLSYYITDHARVEPGIFAGKRFVPRELVQKVRIGSSLKQAIAVEVAEPLTWTIEYFVPNEVFERFVGKLERPQERRWSGNFFKCADESSHPHWASWNPIGDELNFHDPAYFAPIRFL